MCGRYKLFSVARIRATNITVSITAIPHSCTTVGTKKDVGEEMQFRCCNIFFSVFKLILYSFKCFSRYDGFMCVSYNKLFFNGRSFLFLKKWSIFMQCDSEELHPFYFLMTFLWLAYKIMSNESKALQ